jgi:hypothetical protein
MYMLSALGLLISWILALGFLLIFSDIKIEQPQQHPQSHQACATKLPVASKEDNSVPVPLPISKPPIPKIEDNTPVLLKEGEHSDVKLKVKGSEGVEFPEIPEDDLEKKIRNFIEHRLVSILVKVNVASCTGCSKDDERIIFQLKLMKALYDDDEELIKLYSKNLQPYLTKNGIITDN